MGDTLYPKHAGAEVPTVTPPERPRWIPPVACEKCRTPIRAKVGNCEVYPCEQCDGQLCERCCVEVQENAGTLERER